MLVVTGLKTGRLHAEPGLLPRLPHSIFSRRCTHIRIASRHGPAPVAPLLHQQNAPLANDRSPHINLGRRISNITYRHQPGDPLHRHIRQQRLGDGPQFRVALLIIDIVAKMLPRGGKRMEPPRALQPPPLKPAHKTWDTK